MQKHNFEWKNKATGKYVVWVYWYKIQNLTKLNNVLLRATGTPI